jgi:predicted small lipoprotein YifL
MMLIPQPSRRRRVLRTLVLVALVGGLAACGRKGEIIDLVPPPPDPEPTASKAQAPEPPVPQPTVPAN